MCPTFMATGDEDKSTRGQGKYPAGISYPFGKEVPFDHEEIYRVMDLCLSCKACKSECPSNVDMTKFKAEFLQHYYEIHGIPFRTLLIGWLPCINGFGKLVRPLTNFITGTSLFKKIIGFSIKRKIPALSEITLKKWAEKSRSGSGDFVARNGKVYLFADEFTNYNESEIGIKTILLLEKLGYQVVIPKHSESARTFLSKGLLKNAKKIAERNVMMLRDIVSESTPLVGIEPSAILTFRDEFPEIVNDNLKESAVKLGACSMMLEEFLCREFDQGKISSDQFTKEPASIMLHGHCQQKSIASTSFTKKMLSIPANYKVEEIPSGCCGMAGSFGYEKEHFELSMRIGEMVLFPAVRSAPADALIAAPGTSCRNQIMDGTGRRALHPAEIMYEAMVK